MSLKKIWRKPSDKSSADASAASSRTGSPTQEGKKVKKSIKNDRLVLHFDSIEKSTPHKISKCERLNSLMAKTP